MFITQDIVNLAKAAGLVLSPLSGVGAEDADNKCATFTDALNEYTKTFMPQGAPSLTLSKMQAEAVRDLLAPGWAMHSIKITAFEQLAHLPMYAERLGGEASYKEIAATRQALAQIEYVLSALTMVKPGIEPNHFIQFLRDPNTRVMAPMYNHLLALQYADKLTRAWQQIPVFGEGQAN